MNTYVLLHFNLLFASVLPWASIVRSNEPAADCIYREIVNQTQAGFDTILVRLFVPLTFKCDGQQLAARCFSPQSRALLALPGQNVIAIAGGVSPQQIITGRPSYVRRLSAKMVYELMIVR